MSKQPEALRLACALSKFGDGLRPEIYDASAAELRRQHAAITALMAAIEKLADYPLDDFGLGNKLPSRPLFGASDWTLTVGDVRKAREAYAQAKELM